MGIVVDNEVFYFFNYLFTFYFWLCWVFMAVHGLSLVVVIRGYSLVVVLGLLCVARALGCMHFSSCGTGFSSCSSWVLEHKLSS